MKHHVFAIGIDQYDRYGPLSYCANDAELFAETMQSLASAECVVLTARRGKRLERREVRDIVDRLPEYGFGPDDVVTFYFAGHGLADEGADYFLTSDSDPRSLDTLVPTADVVRALRESRAGLTLFVLDACRVPGPNRTGSRFGDGTRETSKKLGIVSVFGCAPNQTCQESGQLEQGHGVFTYALARLLIEQRELVPLNANRLLPPKVRELTERLGLAPQDPEIALSNLNSATRDVLSGREIRVVERPKRMLILAGLPNAGKSTIGLLGHLVGIRV